MESRIDWRGKVKITAVDVEVELSKNDIYNWIQQCNDPDTLRYLSSSALNRAMRIQYPFIYKDDDDDFRSRS